MRCAAQSCVCVREALRRVIAAKYLVLVIVTVPSYIYSTVLSSSGEAR